MTPEEIIRMAREAGLEIGVEFIAGHKTNIERFAALVAAHEREVCAKVCDEIATKEWDAYKGRTEPIDRDKLYNPHVEGISDGADECAAAIRARGDK